jgi:hypothetical protein
MASTTMQTKFLLRENYLNYIRNLFVSRTVQLVQKVWFANTVTVCWLTSPANGQLPSVDWHLLLMVHSQFSRRSGHVLTDRSMQTIAFSCRQALSLAQSSEDASIQFEFQIVSSD